jgi:hypothetical protein
MKIHGYTVHFQTCISEIVIDAAVKTNNWQDFIKEIIKQGYPIRVDHNAMRGMID